MWDRPRATTGRMQRSGSRMIERVGAGICYRNRPAVTDGSRQTVEVRIESGLVGGNVGGSEFEAVPAVRK